MAIDKLLYPDSPGKCIRASSTFGKCGCLGWKLNVDIYCVGLVDRKKKELIFFLCAEVIENVTLVRWVRTNAFYEVRSAGKNYYLTIRQRVPTTEFYFLPDPGCE